jgi:hypothetical protein
VNVLPPKDDMGMTMEFQMTKHQVARTAMPDAETYDKIHLLKSALALWATYVPIRAKAKIKGMAPPAGQALVCPSEFNETSGPVVETRDAVPVPNALILCGKGRVWRLSLQRVSP